MSKNPNVLSGWIKSIRNSFHSSLSTSVSYMSVVTSGGWKAISRHSSGVSVRGNFDRVRWLTTSYKESFIGYIHKFKGVNPIPEGSIKGVKNNVHLNSLLATACFLIMMAHTGQWRPSLFSHY